MKLPARRTAALIAVGVAGALLLGWLVASQGPLAPARVTVAKVQALPAPRVAAAGSFSTHCARR